MRIEVFGGHEHPWILDSSYFRVHQITRVSTVATVSTSYPYIWVGKWWSKDDASLSACRRDPLARQNHNITLWSMKLPQELLSPNQTWTAKHLQNSGERGHRVLSILLLASLKRTTWRESHMNRPHFEDQIFKVRQKTRQQLNSPQVNLSLKRMTPRCPSGKAIGINGCIQHTYPLCIYIYTHTKLFCSVTYIVCIYIYHENIMNNTQFCCVIISIATLVWLTHPLQPREIYLENCNFSCPIWACANPKGEGQ